MSASAEVEAGSWLLTLIAVIPGPVNGNAATKLIDVGESTLIWLMLVLTPSNLEAKIVESGVNPVPVTMKVEAAPAIADEGVIEVMDGGGSIVNCTLEGATPAILMLAVTDILSGVPTVEGAVNTSPASEPQSAAEHFRLRSIAEEETFLAFTVRLDVCPGSRTVGLADRARIAGLAKARLRMDVPQPPSSRPRIVTARGAAHSVMRAGI